MTTTSTKPEKSKPAAEVRHGRVRIAIWERTSGTGRFYVAGHPEISYKDDADQWQKGASFSSRELDDLLIAAVKAKAELNDLNMTAHAEAYPNC